MSDDTDAGISAIVPPVCTICTTSVAKYACPRCSARTCSAPCSSAHKTRTGCSGERNKAAYVPMNQYGYGALMGDYTFLEEMGRHVTVSGRDIAQGRYAQNERERGAGRGGLRGGIVRLRGRGGSLGGRTRSKRDILKFQLDLRDIDMDVLPSGMERRRLNQSVWDHKNRTALMTLELRFHTPPHAITSHSDPVHILLTHRNSLELPLLSHIQRQVSERAQKLKDGGKVPPWLHDLVCPDPDAPETFVHPACYMAVTSDPRLLAASWPGATKQHKACYTKLDPTQKISNLLRYRQFVEYPTIDIWEEGAFDGALVDEQGSIEYPIERPVKRRKTGQAQGKRAMGGLIGGYGSESEGEAGKQPSTLLGLGNYGPSDEEDADADDETSQAMVNGPNSAEAGPELIMSDGDDEAEQEKDGQALLDKIREIQGSAWEHEPTLNADDEAEGEVVDWLIDDGSGDE